MNIKIASLWQKEKNGMIYFSGKLGDANIIMFENTKAEPGKNQPTHNLYVTDFVADERKRKRDEAFDKNPDVANTDNGYQPSSRKDIDDDIIF